MGARADETAGRHRIIAYRGVPLLLSGPGLVQFGLCGSNEPG